MLRADIQRTFDYIEGGRLRKTLGCLRAPGVHAVVVFRYGQWTRRRALPLRLILEPIYFIANELLKIVWGIELPRAAHIGPGLYIGHFGGITVSRQAVLGRRCTLSQNVTIGVSGRGERRGTPVIGDNVYIAPGARLFGKITIGDNVQIGANAVVYKDIPPNAIVVLDPGFKIVGYDESRNLDINP